MSPADLSISEAGAKLRDGSLTAVALAQAHLARIAQRDAALHAFVLVAGERALEQARLRDAEFATGKDRGPLHGIPVGIKDLIDVEGLPTGCGSPAFRASPAKAGAEAVRRLEAAGAVILGKLDTYEWALVGPSFDRSFPPAANPWNTAHITGGSSSGCASAVAGGLLRTSLGTDTGGSVRSPAAYCGAVALKGTFGSVPVSGVFPLSPSLDHVGPVSASVAEAALTFDAIADPDPERPPAAGALGQPVEGLRIAYARDFFAHDPLAHPAVVAAVDAAASMLSLLGARVAEVALPPYDVFEAAGAVILQAEALVVHLAAMRARSGDYGRLASQSLASGLCLTEADAAQARRATDLLRATLDQTVFPRFDALLTVNTLTPAPPFSAFDGEHAVWTPMRTIPFNVTGHPVLALPSGFAENLPVGIQIAGPWNGEAIVCRTGHAFEQATDHALPRPAFAPAG